MLLLLKRLMILLNRAHSLSIQREPSQCPHNLRNATACTDERTTTSQLQRTTDIVQRLQTLFRRLKDVPNPCRYILNKIVHQGAGVAE